MKIKVIARTIHVNNVTYMTLVYLCFLNFLDDNSLQRQRDIVYLVFLGNDFCEKMNNVSNDKTIYSYMTYNISQTLVIFNNLL